MRSSSARINVPLPTPEGPVMTKTLASALAAQQPDQLVALALGQAADGLARRDLALTQDLVDLHAPVLRDGEQHVDDLRGLDELRRLQEQLVDRTPPRLEVALELRALGADLVGALQGIHALNERPLRGRRLLRGGIGRRRRHGRRVYTEQTPVQAPTSEKSLDLKLSLMLV